DYTHALELEPDRASVHASRGWAHVVLESPRLALRDFEKVLALEPKNADAHNGHGFALVKLGPYREGIADAEEALRLAKPDARMLYNAARTYSWAVLRVQADPAEQTQKGREL